MIAEHLPVLLVVVPLMAAPVCVALRHALPVWTVAQAVSLVTFAMALALLGQVLDHGTVVYAIGDWAAPWGIEYRVDAANAWVAVVVTTIAVLVMPYAPASIEGEIDADRAYLFYAMLLLCLSGQLGITVTGDAFNLFVFLEISSLSTYVLVALGRDRRALMAAYRYLVMGTIGATFYIIGVGLLYMMTGTLNMADLAARIPEVADTRTVAVALAFLTVGISLKIALFPLHLWLPNAYAYAPSVVTVFLSATATKVAVYVLIRIFFSVFDPIDVMDSDLMAETLRVLAVIGMVAASLVALYQDNLKRMLAYSSVAQVGYMILGVSFVSVAGLTGGLVHLFNHALMKAALFMAMGVMALRLGSVHIDDLAGIGRRLPATMAAFVVAGLSLIGVPGTVGFISKWYLVQAALAKGQWAVAALVLGSSLLAVAYVGRVVEAAYLRPAPAGAPPLDEAPLAMLIPLWLLAGSCVVFGLWADGTAGVATTAARALLGEPLP